MTKIIDSISDIISLYDVFILDQWGVMHDGYKGYDHAINAVEKLIKENKKLIIISNSSKRKNSSIGRLKSLGFDKNHFMEVMTSGEMVWQEIATSIDNYGNDLQNCFHIYDSTKEDGLEFRNGLEKFNFVSKINDANFILACTPFENSEPIDYIPILKEALNMNLIMFCANPDFVTIEKSNDQNIYCMGTIADLYEHMGGKVVILGKPSKEIYEESCKKILHYSDLGGLVIRPIFFDPSCWRRAIKVITFSYLTSSSPLMTTCIFLSAFNIFEISCEISSSVKG